MIIVKPILIVALRVASFILFALTIVSGYCGYVNPIFWATPAIGSLLFPYLAIGTLLTSIVWFICRRFITGGVGILALLCCGSTLFMSLPVNFSKKSKVGEKTFTIVSFNCIHFQDLRQPGVVPNRSLQWILDADADIVGMAEIYGFAHVARATMTETQLDSLDRMYPYISTDGTHDVQLMSKYPFTEEVLPVLEIYDEVIDKTYWFRGYGLYKLRIRGLELNVMMVHLPSFQLNEEERDIITDVKGIGSAKRSLKEFRGSVREKMEDGFRLRALITERILEILKDIKEPVIVCGDFNDVPGSWCYREFLKSGLRDAYTETSFGYIPTYNLHLMYFHIDQMLYKGNLRPLYVKRSKMDASDHYPLIAEFAY